MHIERRLQRAGGFSLLEILTALAVLSVAVYILTALFLASLSVGDDARLRDTAAAIAAEQMQALVHAPGDFEWPPFHEHAPVEILPALEADEWHAPPVPDAFPSTRHSHDREQIFHDRFGWRAYARVLEEAPSVVELTVVVSWTHGGRPQSFVLTSAMARSAVPGGAS